MAVNYIPLCVLNRQFSLMHGSYKSKELSQHLR